MNEANKNKLQEVVEELIEKTKAELKKEKKEREGNEDTLLSMLESTCDKIQTISD